MLLTSATARRAIPEAEDFVACNLSDVADDPRAIFDRLREVYADGKRPIRVDFRALMPSASAHDRATHLLHPYPAKLLRHIPALFVSVPQLSEPGDTVLDPFCGSGTVLVEASLAGRQAIGCDANPLAVLLAGVKSTPIPAAALRPALKRVLAKLSRVSGPIPAEKRLAYWFYPEIAQQLASIRASIATTRRDDVRAFLDACLSACAHRVSLADPRISVPVRLRSDQYQPGHWLYERTNERLVSLRHADVFAMFTEMAWANARRVEAMTVSSRGSSRVAVADARRLAPACASEFGIAPGSIDLVVTSPPYLGAQKYIRASSLGLLWLDFAPDGDLRPLIAASIGREHFRKAELEAVTSTGIPAADAVITRVRSRNLMRAHLAATYLVEMRAALSGIADMLRPGGNLVLVVGGNTLCGEPFETPAYLEQLANELGLSTRLSLVDTIRSRGLMTRRNRAASPITQETVLVLTKRAGNG